MTDTAQVFQSILALVDPSQLAVHCHKVLHKELKHAQTSFQDARLALQRLENACDAVAKLDTKDSPTAWKTDDLVAGVLTMDALHQDMTLSFCNIWTFFVGSPEVTDQQNQTESIPDATGITKAPDKTTVTDQEEPRGENTDEHHEEMLWQSQDQDTESESELGNQVEDDAMKSLDDYSNSFESISVSSDEEDKVTAAISSCSSTGKRPAAKETPSTGGQQIKWLKQSPDNTTVMRITNQAQTKNGTECIQEIQRQGSKVIKTEQVENRVEIAGNGKPNKQHKTDKMTFDCAMEYISMIRQRFATQPTAYEEILTIFAEGQKDDASIRQELDRICYLFRDHPDLLRSFASFVPDHLKKDAKERLFSAAELAERRKNKR